MYYFFSLFFFVLQAAFAASLPVYGSGSGYEYTVPGAGSDAGSTEPASAQANAAPGGTTVDSASSSASDKESGMNKLMIGVTIFACAPFYHFSSAVALILSF